MTQSSHDWIHKKHLKYYNIYLYKIQVKREQIQLKLFHCVWVQVVMTLSSHDTRSAWVCTGKSCGRAPACAINFDFKRRSAINFDLKCSPLNWIYYEFCNDEFRLKQGGRSWQALGERKYAFNSFIATNAPFLWFWNLGLFVIVIFFSKQLYVTF